MSSVSGLFTGNSTYSSDFVQVIDRAVQIASLPIDQLNTQKTLLSDEKTALSGLASAFSSLESAVSSLNTSIDTGRYSVSYSDNTVAIASASSGTLPGTYTVQIVDTGTQARANSTATVSDPLKSSISTGTDFTLTVNGKVYSNIKPATNTLNSLAEAINSVTKSDVQATVVNVGTSASPSYQLSIQNSKYGTATITLDDGSGNVLGTPTSGAPVQYRINGQPSGSPLTSDSRTLTISPNLTVTALKTGTTDVVISQTTSNLASALNSFVSAYNGITTALDAQRGDKKGALAGQSIVNTLSQMMRQISGYSRTGSIGSITDIGLTFDKNGVLSFDASALSAAGSKDFKAVTEFLGSASGTSGFLKASSACLKSITDSNSGILSAASSSVSREISTVDTQINSNQDRVDYLRESLNKQMAAADALIASLQQQVTYFTSMFTAMQTNQRSMS